MDQDQLKRVLKTRAERILTDAEAFGDVDLYLSRLDGMNRRLIPLVEALRAPGPGSVPDREPYPVPAPAPGKRRRPRRHKPETLARAGAHRTHVSIEPREEQNRNEPRLQPCNPRPVHGRLPFRPDSSAWSGLREVRPKANLIPDMNQATKPARIPGGIPRSVPKERVK